MDTRFDGNPTTVNIKAEVRILVNKSMCDINESGLWHVDLQLLKEQMAEKLIDENSHALRILGKLNHEGSIIRLNQMSLSAPGVGRIGRDALRIASELLRYCHCLKLKTFGEEGSQLFLKLISNGLYLSYQASTDTEIGILIRRC